MRNMGLFSGIVLLSVMLASCSFGSSKRDFGPYSEAETFYRQGNYPKAIVKYQDYLAKYPQGALAATAQYYIAKSYIAAGDAAQAEESFEQVEKKNPGTSWAAFAADHLETLRSESKA